MTKKKLNIDFLELVFDYNQNFITDLLNEPKTMVKTLIFNNKKTYIVEDLFEVRVLEPLGVVEGRIYIKILNQKLYKDGTGPIKEHKLITAILRLKELSLNLNINLLTLNRLDLAYDILDIDIFELIDLNKLNEYKTGSYNKKRIYLETQSNNDGGKTLYFNTIDIEEQKKKRRYRKQRINATLYTKSRELDITNNKYKKSYQNPGNKLITRLELKLVKDNVVSKETFLLKAMANYLWTDPKKFLERKDALIQYVFMEYKTLYYLEGDAIILEYDILFKDHNDFDFIYINDFIDDIFKKSITDYNIKTKKYRTTYVKPIFKKKLYLENIESIINLWQTDFIEYMTKKNIEKLLEITGATHHHQLDIVKIKEDKETNGRNLHKEIHLNIYSYLQANPIKNNYEVKSCFQSIEDLF
jgi:hypothetical protein